MRTPTGEPVRTIGFDETPSRASCFLTPSEMHGFGAPFFFTGQASWEQVAGPHTIPLHCSPVERECGRLTLEQPCDPSATSNWNVKVPSWF
jgi:hypothetical protein